MRGQLGQMLFYLVFLSQVLLISFYFPRKILGRVKHVVENYPPSAYPRLYPVSLDVAKKAQRTYWNMNLFALLAGIALVLVGLFRPTEEMLDWNTDSVLLIYLLLQYSPLIIASTAGFTYFSLMRKADSRTTRKAELRRRSLFDFVSPAVLSLAIFAYVGFVLLILYVRQFEFPWFGGYSNIVGITAANLLFAGVIVRNLYGKKRDPYQAYEDRTRQIGITVRGLVWTSILATVFVALSIGLAAFELRHLQPMSLSLYVQVLAVITFRAT
jgi:hypothetical protein